MLTRLALSAVLALGGWLAASGAASAQGPDSLAARSCRGPMCEDLFPAEAPPTSAIDWEAVSDGASTVFFRFFGQLTPNADGVQRPEVRETTVSELAVPLGDSHLSVVSMANGNNFGLTPVRFYREYNGMLALRYGLFEPGAMQVSLTASPLAGTYANVSGYAGVEPGEHLPEVVVLGGAGGVDFTYTRSAATFTAHAYAMPGQELASGRLGVRYVQTLEATFILNRFVSRGRASSLELTLQALHVERGDAEETLYRYEVPNFRGPRDLREVWQGMAFLTVRDG